jgi:hypothetical protein
MILCVYVVKKLSVIVPELNRIPIVQECDATMPNRITEAGYKKII